MFEDSRSTCLRPCFTYFIHMEWRKHFRHHLNRAVFLTAISQIGKIVAFHSGPNFQMNPFERQGALDLKLLWASGGINNNVSGERLPKFEMMFYLFMQVFFFFLNMNFYDLLVLPKDKDKTHVISHTFLPLCYTSDTHKYRKHTYRQWHTQISFWQHPTMWVCGVYIMICIFIGAVLYYECQCVTRNICIVSVYSLLVSLSFCWLYQFSLRFSLHSLAPSYPGHPSLLRPLSPLFLPVPVVSSLYESLRQSPSHHASPAGEKEERRETGREWWWIKETERWREKQEH